MAGASKSVSASPVQLRTEWTARQWQLALVNLRNSMSKQAIVKLAQMADVLMICAGPGVLTDQEFTKMISSSQHPSVRKILGLDAGPTEMTSVQRKSVASVAKDRGLFVVTITNEKLTRGIVTAVSWLGANIKAYSWDDLRTGIQQLGLPPDQEDQMLTKAVAMRAQVSK
jgi:hypothetical protein